MSKRALAQLLTLTTLGATLALILWQRREAPTVESATPQQTIHQMFDAVQAGDTRRYLASYAAPLRAELEQSGGPPAQFAVYLRQQNAGVKGLALGAAQGGGNQVRIPVEYIYPDRNELQWLTLQRQGGQWLITKIEAALHQAAPVPYGTPVN
jgi:hypothetical protein